jgi:alpha-glucosidase
MVKLLKNEVTASKEKSERRKLWITRISLVFNACIIALSGFVGIYKYDVIIDCVLRKLSGDKTQVVMYGNSLIEGGKWNYLLKRGDVHNSGWGSIGASHLADLVNAKVTRFNPAICFVEGGINDIGNRTKSLNAVADDMSKVIDTLLAHRVVPVLTLTLYTNLEARLLHGGNPLKANTNQRVDSLNALYAELARQKGIECLDLNADLSADRVLKAEYTTDGVHLNSKGYKIWAQRVKETLVRHDL